MVLVPRLRRLSSGLMERIASSLPPYPNAYTLIGLVLVACAAIAGLHGEYLLGLILGALGALMDAVDGAVARHYGLASRMGAVLDSITDRVEDVLLAVGLWRAAGPPAVYLLSVSSLIYSYVRARGEAALCKKLEGVGLLERGERVPLLLLAYLVASVSLKAAAVYTWLLAILVTAAAAARAVQVLRVAAEA